MPKLGGQLSENEMKVMVLVTRGMTNDEIASELYYSVNSIKQTLANAMKKTGTTNRVQLAVWTIWACIDSVQTYRRK